MLMTIFIIWVILAFTMPLLILLSILITGPLVLIANGVLMAINYVKVTFRRLTKRAP